MKIFSALLLFFAITTPVLAQSTQPSIALSVGSEDGKKVIRASVTLNGKPIENVVLQYFVQRTFGELTIGEDTTLDDGSSAIAYPMDLPGGLDGKVDWTIRIKTPAQYASASVAQSFPSEARPSAAADQFPRALWAPDAPVSLMLTVFVLLAAVWLSYLFVVTRVLAIRAGGKI